MSSRPATIGLLWHSLRAGNLGVGALSLADIEIVRRVLDDLDLDARLVTIGWDDPGPTYPGVGADVEHVGLRLVDFVPFVGSLHATLRRCDLVIDISAGDSFADIYGRHRFLTQAASKLAVGTARRPLVLAPQTYGPFERATSRVIARRILRRAETVASRDPASIAHVREIGVQRTVVDTADVATALPFTPVDHGPGRHVGVNVSGLLVHGGYRGSDMFDLTIDYPALVRAMIARLVADERFARVHLVPHVIEHGGSVEDDVAACRALADEYDVVVAPEFDGPIAAKSYIAGLDAFSGARMHACIAAVSAGVPVLPVAYSRKFNGMFESLGYPWLIDGRRDDDARAMQRLDEFLDRLDQARLDAVSAADRAATRLDGYRDELRRVIGSLRVAS